MIQRPFAKRKNRSAATGRPAASTIVIFCNGPVSSPFAAAMTRKLTMLVVPPISAAHRSDGRKAAEANAAPTSPSRIARCCNKVRSTVSSGLTPYSVVNCPGASPATAGSNWIAASRQNSTAIHTPTSPRKRSCKLLHPSVRPVRPCRRAGACRTSLCLPGPH